MGARPFVVDGFAMAPEQPRSLNAKPIPDEDLQYPIAEQSMPDPSERHLITYVDSEPPQSCYRNNTSAFPEGRYFDVEVVRSPVWIIDAMVVFNVISAAVIFGRNGWKIDHIHSNPLLGPSVTVLDQYGLRNTFRIINKNEWWRLLTSIFLHAGAADLIYTILVLLIAGIPLESAFGFRAIVFIYMTSGLMGMAVSSVFTPNIYSVGAVAAAAGLLGARIGDVTKNGLELRKGSVQWTSFMSIALLAFGIGLGLMPLMDNVAIIVGFGMGFLAGLALLKLRTKIGPDIHRSNLTLVELLAGICWLLLVFSAVLNFNEVRFGRTCFYCVLPSWFPLCMENRFWTCASQFIIKPTT